MFNFKRPRLGARMTVAIWGIVGLLGSALAVVAILLLAGLGTHLPLWFPLAGAGKGAQFFGFIVGVSLGCLSLWGIYSQTIHARETHF
jgi:hypothetical protein